MKIFDKISLFFTPLHVIAKELSILRELYELDLASRNPPVYRITEKPGKDDTEVTYADEAPKKKSALRDLIDQWTEEDDSVQSTNN